MPIKINGIPHDSLSSIYQPRRSNANAQKRTLSKRDQFIEQPINRCQSRVAVPSVYRQIETMDDLSSEVDHGSPKLTFRQVNPYETTGIIHHAEKDRRFARP